VLSFQGYHSTGATRARLAMYERDPGRGLFLLSYSARTLPPGHVFLAQAVFECSAQDAPSQPHINDIMRRAGTVHQSRVNFSQTLSENFPLQKSPYVNHFKWSE
jgi:hypothetical protein